jgi:hypothetical protein
MRFSLWTQYGALNSREVFDAFAHSLVAAGHTVTWNDSNSDVDVIWSVLWHGRMARNKAIWQRNVAQSKPTIVLEVGGIKRGTTWKVGLNGINRDGYFGDKDNDRTRADNLGLVCKPWRSNGDFILIAGQHDKSLQWQGLPRMSNWFLNTYDEIRKYTDRPIIFRPHPRCKLEHIERGLKHVYRQVPQHVNGTYDDFDMGFNNIHCTISYSSNPGIHSIIQGVPAFVSTHSLAYDVSNDIDFLHDIEQPLTPDRTQWLNDYAHTEYTIEEISQGIPLKHLTSHLI